MNSRRTDRIWLFGGLLVIVGMIVASWFLAISPKLQEAEDVQGQADDMSVRLVALKREVAELKTKAAKEASYRADHDKYRAALPKGWSQSAFLRQLQASGTSVNVEVSGMTAGEPAKSPADPGVVELPITLTAEGTTTDLSRFLDRLQNVQPRAVLITSANLSIDGDNPQLNLTLNAFLSP